MKQEYVWETYLQGQVPLKLEDANMILGALKQRPGWGSNKTYKDGAVAIIESRGEKAIEYFVTFIEANILEEKSMDTIKRDIGLLIFQKTNQYRV